MYDPTSSGNDDVAVIRPFGADPWTHAVPKFCFTKFHPLFDNTDPVLGFPDDTKFLLLDKLARKCLGQEAGQFICISLNQR